MSRAQSTRASRFAARMRGEHVPSFADLARPHGWQDAGSDERANVAKVLALLAARPQIDRELNGQRLAQLAEAIGESAFDRVCDTPIDRCPALEEDAALPAPRDLQPRGLALLELAERRADIAELADLALEIVRTESTAERVAA